MVSEHDAAACWYAWPRVILDAGWRCCPCVVVRRCRSSPRNRHKRRFVRRRQKIDMYCRMDARIMTDEWRIQVDSAFKIILRYGFTSPGHLALPTFFFWISYLYQLTWTEERQFYPGQFDLFYRSFSQLLMDRCLRGQQNRVEKAEHTIQSNNFLGRGPSYPGQSFLQMIVTNALWFSLLSMLHHTHRPTSRPSFIFMIYFDCSIIILFHAIFLLFR